MASKHYWPATMAEFRELERKAHDKYLPLLMSLSLHDLGGLQLALAEAMDAIIPEANAEDIKNGRRLRSVAIGNAISGRTSGDSQ